MDDNNGIPVQPNKRTKPKNNHQSSDKTLRHTNSSVSDLGLDLEETEMEASIFGKAASANTSDTLEWQPSKSKPQGSAKGLSVGATEDAFSETIAKPGASKDAKIIEIAKKMMQKELNVATSNRTGTFDSQSADTKQTAAMPPSSDIKMLKDKVQQLSRKLEDERIISHTLKNESRNLQKALVQEVGEDIPIQKIMSGELGGWKGRSEQILLLKDKIKDLTRKLGSAGLGGAGAGAGNARSETAVGNAGMMESTGDGDEHERRHRDSIQKLEQSRRNDFDREHAELEQLRQSHTKIKSKCDALLARSRTLEKEVKDYKSKIAVLLNKGDNDDKLIRALHDEIGRIKAAVVMR
eukprot:jgi/Hompol1/5564/HPOL_004546-RA